MRRVGSVVAISLLAASAALAQARDAVLEAFRTQVEIEKRVLAIDLGQLERLQGQLGDATDRLVRLGDDLLRAEKEGEDSGSLAARSADLRRAEGEVAELITAAQQLRLSIQGRRGHLEQVQAEVKRLEESKEVKEDEVSGRWQVAIEPGGQKGSFDLKLDGTLVSGSYLLSGGWKGSLRGTYIGGNLRLERIDTQLGFVATYTARMAWRDGERRLEGAWEATNLAAGMPSTGSWVARKETAR